MKTKFLLAAVALPMVFAACSQDELLDSQYVQDVPANAIKGLTLELSKAGTENSVETRGVYDIVDRDFTWSNPDYVSLYWLGEKDASSNSFGTAYARNTLDGKFNSIFATTNGSKFTSEALVFEGGNIAVYPADKAFTKEGKILVTVEAETASQTDINNMPFISNQLYIQKPQGYEKENTSGYYGTGGFSLKAPMKQAAHYVALKLNVSNAPTDPKFNFGVTKVELRAVDGHFATESAITTKASAPNDKGSVEYKKDDNNSPVSLNTIVSQAWTTPSKTVKTITSTYVEDNVAHFLTLPGGTAITADDFANVQIVVHTTCGIITLDGESTPEEGKAIKNPVIKTNDDGTTKEVVIAQFLNDIIAPATGGTNSIFKGEDICGRFVRTINVDAGKAVITGSVVENSKQIEHYVDLYSALNKTDDVTLHMTGSNFELTKAAVAAVNGNEKFSLNTSGVTNLVLTEGGAVSDYNLKKVSAVKNVVLAAGKDWALTDNYEFTMASAIENKGTLTIKGTTNKTLVTAVTNVAGATIKIDGSLLTLKGANFNMQKNSIIDIEAGQELAVGVSATGVLTFNGIINVKASDSRLTAATGAVIASDGVVNNYGIVAGTQSAGWSNNGAINSMEGAITYLSANGGVIELTTRTDEVVVAAAEKGKIVYKWNKTNDGTTFAQAVSDRFTYVKFNEKMNLTIVKTDLNADGTLDNPAAISMEFLNECTLTVNGITIKDLTVAEAGDLRIISGNTLTVNKLKNDGEITLGGTINYATGQYTGKGRILTVGTGALLTY